MDVITDHLGRRIRLTHERLAHILEHPEMRGFESRIEESLTSPGTVVQSVSDSSVSLYYRFYQGTPAGPKWLCVVVKVLPADAFVVTAYLTDHMKRGTVLWPTSR